MIRFPFLNFPTIRKKLEPNPTLSELIQAAREISKLRSSLLQLIDEATELSYQLAELLSKFKSEFSHSLQREGDTLVVTIENKAIRIVIALLDGSTEPEIQVQIK